MRILKVLYLLLFFFPVMLEEGQCAESTRRYFLIAYDVSTPFIKAEKSIYEFEAALVDVFSGNKIEGFDEANQETLKAEKENNYTFFDPHKDEISFFHFNIARGEFSHLQWTASNSGERGVVSEFNEAFIKEKGNSWAEYVHSNPKGNIHGFLSSKLSITPSPPEFGRGVSMSNFVYPLVLNHLDSNQYAEEYILIILSDFLTGAMLGNTRDLDRVKDIYGVKYYERITSASPVSYLKQHIDQLAAKFYKVDYFQYSFVSQTSNQPIGIIAYKIKPKVGIRSPEDVAIFIDGDLGLRQKGYESTTFSTTDVSVKFTHNPSLSVEEVHMSILSDNGGHTFFSGAVASKATGVWKSNYTDQDDLMQFDEASLTYHIPPLRMELDEAINKRDFDQVSFLYEFKTNYSSVHAAPLGYLYATQRSLPLASVSFATKTTIIMMYYMLPASVLLAIVIWFIYRGRPKAIELNIDGYLDSYEKVDFRTVGRRLKPYVAWNKIENKQDYIQVNGQIGFPSAKFLFNWGVDVVVSLEALEVPKGFELFTQRKPNDGREFSNDQLFALKKDGENRFHFVVGVRQTDLRAKLDEPRLVRFKVNVNIEHSVLFARAKLQKSIEYQFQLGEDLGHVWVGIDPGTTGSCMAVGSNASNIVVAKDPVGNSIIPSLLTFDTSTEPDDVLRIGEHYWYGTGAEGLAGKRKTYKSFGSVKKLLGFKDVKEINFQNGKQVKFTGKDLASLLVKNVFYDVKQYFLKPALQIREYQTNGQFNPKRAVVAVPNNFTLTQIQDMVDSVKSIKSSSISQTNENPEQFKEVRYISEAEAVLFYHLSNLEGKASKAGVLNQDQNILVFDMGGATINVTIAHVKFEIQGKSPKYQVDILAKIGYGIGGDTIDYCLSEFILRFHEEFPELGNREIGKDRGKLSKMARGIKMDLTERLLGVEKKDTFLIQAAELQKNINSELGISVDIPVETAEDTGKLYSYFKKAGNNYRVLTKSFIDYLVYKNVVDAVEEALALSGNSIIDKVIFSGRSTAFPFIKQKAIAAIGKGQTDVKPEKVEFGLAMSKTAVAMGACWYGIHEGAVTISKLKAAATFGFTKTSSPNKNDLKFHRLIGMNEPFKSSHNSTPYIERKVEFNDSFTYDGRKVNFYQVMGANASEIIINGQKHKYSRIASIDLHKPTSQVGIRLNEDDSTECAVGLQPSGTIRESGLVADQEVKEANQEHYTWTTDQY